MDISHVKNMNKQPLKKAKKETEMTENGKKACNALLEKCEIIGMNIFSKNERIVMENEQMITEYVSELENI